MLSNVFAAVHAQGVRPDDRLLLFLPLYYVFGQNAILNSAFAGAATVMLQRWYDPQGTLAVVERDGVRMFYGVPTICIGLLNAGVSPERLRSVRYCFSAAATMPVDVGEHWKATYARLIVEGYGLTETSPFASFNHVWYHRPGSVGTRCALTANDFDAYCRQYLAAYKGAASGGVRRGPAEEHDRQDPEAGAARRGQPGRHTCRGVGRESHT